MLSPRWIPIPLQVETATVAAAFFWVPENASLLTSSPQPDQLTDQLTFNWRKMNILAGLGDRWYTSVLTWWGLFIITILALFVLFSGFVL